jgi:hypothetical protein
MIVNLNLKKDMWRKYRFYVNKTSDIPPKIVNPRFPWWCVAKNEHNALIVAYLPPEENIYKYWATAYNVEYDVKDKIEFTERFQKPFNFEE